MPRIEEDDREQRTAEAADQPLDHERAAHEPVGRADELHHLDLTSAREDREPDRVRDQQRRCDPEQDRADQEDGVDHVRKPEHEAPQPLAVGDLLDARQVRALKARRDLAEVLGLRRRDVELIRERIPRQLADELRVRASSSAASACAFGTNTNFFTFGFDWRIRATAFSCAFVAGPPLSPLVLKSILTISSLLDVVRPRARQRAERDEEAEHEHADEHGHRRGEGGRDVGGEAAPGLGDEQAESHSPV